jgi:serine/threonine protein phosphatase 1
MKIFAISDLHSYLTPTLKALKDAGWDGNNPEHIIIVCGDALDRGNETVEMVEWLVDLINKGKLIYIKGNHDLLMQEMLNRSYSMSHDRHNGTEKSYYQLLNAHADKMDGRRPDEIVRTALQPLYDKMVNYFETKKYIFVHSWIPTNVKFEGNSKPWYQQDKTLTWMEDWRNANDVEWEEAMWGNPFKRWEEGLNKTGKTIVFGHFHTSYQWSKNEKCSEFGEDAIFEPYYGGNYIGIDACTAYTNRVNVIVIEDEFINDNP